MTPHEKKELDRRAKAEQKRARRLERRRHARRIKKTVAQS